MKKQTINSAEYLELILKALNHTEVGITLADYGKPDLPLIYVNQAFSVMTGYTKEEVEGKNCRFLQGEIPNNEARDVMRKAIKNGKTCQVLLQNFRKNGEWFWNELHLNPIFDESGNLTHYVGIQHDVTDREKNRESLGIRKELLAETNKKLRRLSDDKNRMMTTVAHDLRSPISNISGLLELIGSADNKEDIRNYVNNAKMTIERMNILVNDYLNYEAIQNGSFNLEKTEVTLKKFAISLSDYLESEARAKSVSFRINTDFKSPTAFFDSNRMEQVVINIFSNALKFSHAGSTIHLDFFSDEGELTIKVIDEGQGIKKNELANIFSAFEKSSTRPTQGETGFGLGLSIVKKIVDIHDGQVNVESDWGHGTTFTITIPANKKKRS